MKNILSILLTCIILFGCSKNNIQNTVLDSDLYGNWTHSTGNYCRDMTLSSNGQFVYSRGYCSGSTEFSSGGHWWVEENNLVLSGDSFGLTKYYSVSDDILDFDDLTWNR